MDIMFEIFGAGLLHSYGGGGILSGFLHPILGLDHLLAMVAVGFLSAQMGGRAIWTVPTAFVVVMAIGAVLGIVGIPVPLVEYGITGSVLILGLGILVNRTDKAEEKAAKKDGKTKKTESKKPSEIKGILPEWLAIVLVSIFSFFHGHAHGTELPELSETVGLIIAYVAGFLIATVGLHVIGALIGIVASRNQQGQMIMRITGGVIAAIGVYLVMGV
ncbi:MAG: HupE/UreJ family protein [Chloroflexota bacterium]